MSKTCINKHNLDQLFDKNFRPFLLLSKNEILSRKITKNGILTRFNNHTSNMISKIDKYYMRKRGWGKVLNKTDILAHLLLILMKQVNDGRY